MLLKLFADQLKADEIKDAMFLIGNDKVPGPDGFNACFFFFLNPLGPL